MLQRYQDAMRSIDLTPQARSRIHASLSAAANRTTPHRHSIPKAALIAAVLAVALVGGALASGLGLSTFFSGGVNDGKLIAEELVILIQTEDDRILLTTPDGELDITDLCSETEPYIHPFTDADGAQHYIIAGGTPEQCGFVEYIQDPATGGFDGQGWLGTRDANETETPEWLKNGEYALGIRP